MLVVMLIGFILSAIILFCLIYYLGKLITTDAFKKYPTKKYDSFDKDGSAHTEHKPNRMGVILDSFNDLRKKPNNKDEGDND